jgi:hypothetical protein
MKIWPHEVKSYTAHDVQVHCVQNAEWQRFRISLKGLSTEEKLDRLEDWRAEHMDQKGEPPYERFLQEPARIQIDNYLQALHRGGLIRPTTFGERSGIASTYIGQFEVVK